MVQSIENRTEVRGRVEEVALDAAGEQLTVRLQVSQLSSVPGYPNLLADVASGSDIVFAAREVADPVHAGDILTCQVKMVGPGRYFALPGSCRIER